MSDALPQLYIVGIGASAGGLDAFTAFFRHMPPDSGMAFVLVQHLDPSQPSLLPELIAAQTVMPVRTVTEPLPVEPDHIYIIAPNTALTIAQGMLSPASPAEARGHRMPIDHFFQSLAGDQGRHAIGIVCSGADTDGTLGLAAIQDAGGLTLAQAPNDAHWPTMPQSAIDRRVVDHILPIDAIPELLRAHVANDGNRLFLGMDATAPEAGGDLQAICAILLRATGHDFRQYKPATLLRRITRRMQLANLADLDAYASQLRHDQSEIDRLFQDLLISVTSFFRDPAAFEALAETIIPALIQQKRADDPLRIWVAGCATGEEAYTVAMLVLEQLERLEIAPPLQLFATDIDEAALAVARLGRYEAGISAHVSAERLARFFVPQGDGYQVTSELRERCLFSLHNLISDPPFARIDLIVCRNLLIYLTADLQRKLMPLLHYALAPGGYLMLGSAESATAYPELFRIADMAQRIFQRNEVLVRPTIPFPLTIPGRRSGRAPLAPRRALLSNTPDLGATLEHLMVKDYAPPAVVVDEQGAIVYFFGHTGAYLEPPAGAASLDIYTMARPELRLALQAALRASWREQTTIRSNVTLTTEDGARRVALIIRPLAELAPESRLTLVLFQEIDVANDSETAVATPNHHPDATIAEQLADELQTTRAALESTIGEFQEANAELTTANEELIAINEELQSANEELQTSKEEIQSINEELQTVNAELHRKIVELDRVNADLANLFASTQIPAIFLHSDGRIARFTPAATEVFRLRENDVGRPITDIAARFHDGDLVVLTSQVLRTLNPYEEAIHRLEPKAWWIMRIRPYRTLADVIDGVVITFTDITTLKQAEADRERLLAQVQAARANAEQIVATMIEPILILDTDLRVISANPAYYQRFATTAAKTERYSLYDLADGVWNYPELRAALNTLLSHETPSIDLELTATFAALGARTLRLQARPIEHPSSDTQWILLAIVDITDLKRTALMLQEAHDALEQRVIERTHELAVVNATLQAEVTEHRRSEQARQHLLHQLVTAQEEERRRVARELHDQLGQDVTGLILGLKALQDASADTTAVEHIQQLQALAIQIGQEVQTLAVRLRPAVLDDLGLAVALTNYVEQWSARALIDVDLHTTGIENQQLPLAIESTIYRLVQETLTNILKHAQATSVSLILERASTEVRLIVEDDGVGFDVASVNTRSRADQRLGLIGMRERVTQLSGTLLIESTPGNGTTVFVTIPLPTNVAGDGHGNAEDLSG